MCSMNAMKTNNACKALYDRLSTNGKTGSGSSNEQAIETDICGCKKQLFFTTMPNIL
jgi:hypothetical protein